MTAPLLPRLAASFTALAESVEADAAVEKRLDDALALCRQAANDRSLGAAPLLVNVSTAVQTWQQVWPRLGGQAPFRQAVAREARLWAKRFSAPQGP